MSTAGPVTRINWFPRRMTDTHRSSVSAPEAHRTDPSRRCSRRCFLQHPQSSILGRHYRLPRNGFRSTWCRGARTVERTGRDIPHTMEQVDQESGDQPITSNNCNGNLQHLLRASATRKRRMYLRKEDEEQHTTLSVPFFALSFRRSPTSLRP
jgi:hypothetical protein